MQMDIKMFFRYIFTSFVLDQFFFVLHYYGTEVLFVIPFGSTRVLMLINWRIRSCHFSEQFDPPTVGLFISSKNILDNQAI